VIACELKEIAADAHVIVACEVTAEVKVEVLGDARVPAHVAPDFCIV